MKPASVQCHAHKKGGEQCQAYAVRGATVCRVHGGSAPQVKDAARYRVLEFADEVAAELVRLALHARSEATRVRACVSVLDYAGLQPVHKVEVTELTDEAIDREIERLLGQMAELDHLERRNGDN